MREFRLQVYHFISTRRLQVTRHVIRDLNIILLFQVCNYISLVLSTGPQILEYSY